MVTKFVMRMCCMSIKSTLMDCCSKNLVYVAKLWV